MKNSLSYIYSAIKNELMTAPGEEELSDEECELYADMQNLKESLESVLKNNKIEVANDSVVINEDNIDSIRDKFNSRYSDCIKTTALNLIESGYEFVLESNKFTEKMLDEIAYEVCGNESFYNDMDSLIMRSIENCIDEYEITNDEEENEY